VPILHSKLDTPNRHIASIFRAVLGNIFAVKSQTLFVYAFTVPAIFRLQDGPCTKSDKIFRLRDNGCGNS